MKSTGYKRTQMHVSLHQTVCISMAINQSIDKIFLLVENNADAPPFTLYSSMTTILNPNHSSFTPNAHRLRQERQDVTLFRFRVDLAESV